MSVKLVEEVMLDRGIPDPRNIRRYDLVGPLGLVNFRCARVHVFDRSLFDGSTFDRRVVFVDPCRWGLQQHWMWQSGAEFNGCFDEYDGCCTP